MKEETECNRINEAVDGQVDSNQLSHLGQLATTLQPVLFFGSLMYFVNLITCDVSRPIIPMRKGFDLAYKLLLIIKLATSTTINNETVRKIDLFIF